MDFMNAAQGVQIASTATAQTDPNTTFTVQRDKDGTLFARSVYPFGAERRELRIDTRKTFRGLRTQAIVVQVSPDGRSYTHAIGLGLCGDYSEELAREPKSRATERAIRDMHAACLARVHEVLASVHRRYPADGAQTV